jgi:C4-dicarboxylate-specific signal transduction histidine kinase
LSASIAHEINQPLGAILTNTETARLMLQSPSPDLGEMKEILADIWRDNRRASEVVRRLRSFVSKAPFQRQEFDLNDVVVESVKFLSAQARSCEITMRSEPTRMPLRIDGDPIQLQQVLSNVILNAMDAVLDRPRAQRAVTVTTTQDRRFAEILSRTRGQACPWNPRQRYLSHFFRPRTTVWAWVFRSLARSLTRTMDR